MTVALDPSLLLRVSADIARRLVATRDAQAVAEAVLPALAHGLGADVANLALKLDEHTLRLVAAVGLSEATTRDWHEFDVAAGIPLAATVRDGRARWIADVRTAKAEFPAIPAGGSASLCTLPLLDRDHVIGVLGVAWKDPHEFHEAEQQLLLTVAALASATLARQPLPAPALLVVREHDAPDGVEVVELLRPGAARCFVHAAAHADPALSLFVSLVDADPRLPSRTIDAIDGLLGLSRRRHVPPAVVGESVAEMSLDLEGPVTGAHLEISPAGGWLAVAPLDHAIVIVTNGRAEGDTEPPLPDRLAGERVVLPDDGPALALAVALDVHSDEQATEAVRAVATAALAEASDAPGAARALLALARRREIDEYVRGAVAVAMHRQPVTPPAPVVYRRRLPATPVSAGLARRFTRATMPAGLADAEVERTELVVDELVTNAIRHANETILVTVTPFDGGVELGVSDDDDRLPDPHVGETGAESGRGYTLLTALADELGVTPRPTGGKTVWARLAW